MNVTGFEAAALFAKAVEERRSIPGLQRELEDGSTRAVNDAVVAEVLRRKPKAKVPKGFGEPTLYPSTRFVEVQEWATKNMPAADVSAFVDGFLTGPRAEHAALSARYEAADERMDETGPIAVFARIPGAEHVVYRDTDHRSQPSAGYYQEVACKVRIAVLEARGFKATIASIPHGFSVVSDAPPAVADVLRFWRLDDVRLLATVGAANLKVLFHPMFPYAGYWDWPADKRENRDAPSFERHRNNENSHLGINRSAVLLPPPPAGPPPRL